MIIQLDIDGVLADFVGHFSATANSMFGTPLTTTEDHHEWNFRWCLTEDQQRRVWDRIRNLDGWWAGMQPLVEPSTFSRIQRMSMEHELYFVTARARDKNPNVGVETVRWLNSLGVSNARVIVNKQKGEIARILRVGYSLEDNWNNAWCIHWMADRPQCRSYLINRPYNMDCRGQTVDKIVRVNTVDDFLDDVECAT